MTVKTFSLSSLLLLTSCSTTPSQNTMPCASKYEAFFGSLTAISNAWDSGASNFDIENYGGSLRSYKSVIERAQYAISVGSVIINDPACRFEKPHTDKIFFNSIKSNLPKVIAGRNAAESRVYLIEKALSTGNARQYIKQRAGKTRMYVLPKPQFEQSSMPKTSTT